MSIRARLTVWYTLVLSVLLGFVGFAVVNVFAATLRDAADRMLLETAKQVFAVSSAAQVLGELRINVPVEADVFRSSGLYLEAIDRDGQVVRRSASLGGYDQPLHAPALESVSLADAPWIDDAFINSYHLRVLTAPIGTQEQLAGFLQIGMSMQANDEALAQLARILTVGWVVGVALSAAGGAFLARQALRPIDTVTQTALSITQAGDLGRRIPEPAARDEVGRLASTLNLMLERLERLFRSQQRFTADVSHELRTPLTTIRGNIDLMRRMRTVDDASLDAIESETDRMTRLVGDLLLLAQADAGLPLRGEAVALDALMLEVFRQVRVIADGAEVRIGAEDAVTVRGDPDRIKQLLLNLTDNAIRYTPSGGRVTLDLRRRDGWAEFSVTDTGPGIPPEHLAHIFERFYRVDKSRSRRQAYQSGALGGGAGLGLSIAQWIATSHGGRIDVRTQVGQGTTFTVFLPEAPANAR